MRPVLTILVSLLLLAVEGHAGKQSDPEEVYRSIEQRFDSGELAQADAEASRALPIGNAAGVLWAAKFRIQRGKVWVYQGRSSEALTLLEPPLPNGLSDGPLAVTRNTLLSIAYRRTNHRAEAAQALAAAETLCGAETSCGEVRLAQGIVDVENDKLADAARAFELSLTSARSRGDNFLSMQSLLNLGVVSLRQEQYDDALDRFGDGAAVARKLGARLELEDAVGNIGWALYKLGDYQTALTNSQLAVQQSAELGVPVDQASWLNDVGLSQYRLGDFNAARSSYEQSLVLARSIQNTEEIHDALIALATLSLQMGDLPGALGRAREARQLAEARNNFSDTLRPSLIEALALERQGQTSAAREQLVQLEQRSAVKPSVRWETQNALANLAAEMGDADAADAWFRRAIETYRSQRSSVASIDSRLPFVENGEALYLSYMEYLIGRGNPDKALNILDQGRSETLAEGLNAHASNIPAAVDPRLLAARSRATILVYSLRPGTSYLWAVSPGTVNFFRLPGRETILPLIDRFNRAIRSSLDVLAQQSGAATLLFHDLVEPAASAIPPHSTVIVVAAEGMYGLNFETLVAPGERPHFWIEDVTLVNASSLHMLAKAPSETKTAGSSRRLLLIGDPVNSRPEFQSLPHAREEMADVAGHFDPARRLVLTGADATPAAYQRSHPSGFAYIHFVSHGVGSGVDPLDSAVILSADPGAAASYKLYAREILNDRLQADLVTISSCYGSGVRSYSGEGMVGLTWAFLHAGAHNVIGALWEVSDTSTPRLMSDLYDGLAHGATPADALRAAKLAMIHRGDIFRKPYYWASFQIYAGA
jgi:CHAT domain-containing protein/tetratricopeptide (TPR) repeat protein